MSIEGVVDVDGEGLLPESIVTIGAWVRQSVVLVVDGVASVSSVSPTLKRGISLICMKINDNAERGDLSITQRPSARKSWFLRDGKPARMPASRRRAQHVRGDQM